MEKRQFTPELEAFHSAMTGDMIIYSWVYSSEGELIYTNCKQGFLAIAFRKSGCKDYALEYGKSHKHPLILSAGLGAMWCAVFEYKDNIFFRLHILGPVFSSSTTSAEIRAALNRYDIQAETRELIISELSSLPTISSMTLFHDVTLFHYFVTGEKITRSDIHFQSSPSKSSSSTNPKNTETKDRNKTYAVEKELLKNVRDGNLNYKEALKNATMISSGINMSASHSLDQAKISCSSFVSLCTRAAIEGGLTPETAYTVGDNYIQAIYECSLFSDLVSINHAMYEDFITRVNRKKQEKNHSNQIQTVLDLIQYHCQEKLTLSELADKVFYSEAYLSRKFKEETGENIHDYLMKVRLKNAAFDLENTNLTVHQIAEKYCFSSSNHLSTCFSKEYGILPNQYRKEKKR